MPILSTTWLGELMDLRISHATAWCLKYESSDKIKKIKEID